MDIYRYPYIIFIKHAFLFVAKLFIEIYGPMHYHMEI